MFYLLKTKRIIKIRSRQRRFYSKIIGSHIIILNNQFGQFILSRFLKKKIFKILSSKIIFGFINRSFSSGGERIDFI